MTSTPQFQAPPRLLNETNVLSNQNSILAATTLSPAPAQVAHHFQKNFNGVFNWNTTYNSTNMTARRNLLHNVALLPINSERSVVYNIKTSHVTHSIKIIL